jgi:hypothetical protein
VRKLTEASEKSPTPRVVVVNDDALIRWSLDELVSSIVDAAGSIHRD